MKKISLKILVFLLVPALLADPATCAAFTNPLASPVAANFLARPAFDDQAMAAVARVFPRSFKKGPTVLMFAAFARISFSVGTGLPSWNFQGIKSYVFKHASIRGVAAAVATALAVTVFMAKRGNSNRHTLLGLNQPSEDTAARSPIPAAAPVISHRRARAVQKFLSKMDSNVVGIGFIKNTAFEKEKNPKGLAYYFIDAKGSAYPYDMGRREHRWEFALKDRFRWLNAYEAMNPLSLRGSEDQAYNIELDQMLTLRYGSKPIQSDVRSWDITATQIIGTTWAIENSVLRILHNRFDALRLPIRLFRETFYTPMELFLTAAWRIARVLVAALLIVSTTGFVVTKWDAVIHFLHSILPHRLFPGGMVIPSATYLPSFSIPPQFIAPFVWPAAFMLTLATVVLALGAINTRIRRHFALTKMDLSAGGGTVRSTGRSMRPRKPEVTFLDAEQTWTVHKSLRSLNTSSVMGIAFYRGVAQRYGKPPRTGYFLIMNYAGYQSRTQAEIQRLYDAMREDNPWMDPSDAAPPLIFNGLPNQKFPWIDEFVDTMQIVERDDPEPGATANYVSDVMSDMGIKGIRYLNPPSIDKKPPISRFWRTFWWASGAILTPLLIINVCNMPPEARHALDQWRIRHLLNFMHDKSAPHIPTWVKFTDVWHAPKASEPLLFYTIGLNQSILDPTAKTFAILVDGQNGGELQVRVSYSDPDGSVTSETKLHYEVGNPEVQVQLKDIGANEGGRFEHAIAVSIQIITTDPNITVSGVKMVVLRNSGDLLPSNYYSVPPPPAKSPTAAAPTETPRPLGSAA